MGSQDLFTRRSLLGGLAAGALAAGGASWLDAVFHYWDSLARPGGWAWPEDPHAFLTVTYAAIASYRAAGREVPRKAEVAEFVRGAYPIPPGRKKDRPLRRFNYEQMQSLAWLGEPLESFRAEVATWERPYDFPKYYEFNGVPVLQQETGAILCRKLLGLPATREWREYILSRRRPNGSFNNTPGNDGSDGHVANTLWALMALQALDVPLDRKQDTIAWLRRCQFPSGGFAYAPRAEIGGNDHIVYTWAALEVLRMLGAEPANPAAARKYLSSLWNADGGFGDRPGRASNPAATREAVEALAALGPLEHAPGTRPRAPRPVAAVPKHLKVFSLEIEAPGSGSPREAVAVARALGIHLWGAKDSAPGWIERAQEIARQERAPVTFFVSNEEYGTYNIIPGIGIYSHLADITAPAGSDFGASMADPKHPHPWETFLRERIGPLKRAGGNNVWQFSDNEELSRMLLDQSVEQATFSSISTFHFGTSYFLFSQPFLNRYRDVMPFIGLQDSHTQTWWWMEYLTAYRTLFLAEEPTWEAWTEALRRRWVLAARHDVQTKYETWLVGASNEVRRHVLDRVDAWRWWGEDPSDMRRPWALLTAVSPADRFDEHRPESGVNLRVRCWMDTQPFGTPKVPVTELVSLEVDGRAVSPEHTVQPRGKGSRGDDYYIWHVPAEQRGHHVAEAAVRMIRTGVVRRVKTEFDVA